MTLLAMELVQLTWWDMAITAGLILVVAAVSLALRLGLEGKLALAGVRTFAQLLLIGYVLRYVFDLSHPLALLPVVAVMIVVAARAAVSRSSRRYPGVGGLAFVVLAAMGLATTLTVTQGIVGVKPWYSPQYIIPLLGMILGNSLTGVSLCLDQLLETLAERRDEVEMELSLGATRWEAARGPVSSAIRRGMIPILNSMMVVGLVSLPGMMTGQILAGADPLEAVKYQIMVMFMLAAAVSVGCMGIGLLTYRRLFNHRHQLRAELIEKRGK